VVVVVLDSDVARISGWRHEESASQERHATLAIGERTVFTKEN